MEKDKKDLNLEDFVSFDEDKEPKKKIREEEIEEQAFNSANPDEELYGEDIEIKGGKVDLLAERCHEIDLRVQELEIRQAKIDDMEESMQVKLIEEYQTNNQEMKDLIKEKRILTKNMRKREDSEESQAPSVWVSLYGFFVLIVSLPGISYGIWLGIAQYISKVFIAGLPSSKAATVVLILGITYIFPIALEIVSLFLYRKAAKKEQNKKLFTVIWILQTIFTIGVMIYLAVKFI